jgi:hypothetical protein
MAAIKTCKDIEQSTELEEIKALLVRCSKPNASAEDRKALQAQFEKMPELWYLHGKLCDYALEAMVSAWSKSALVQESVFSGTRALRQDLGYEQATPLERMLIDHIVLCWTRLQMAEKWYIDRHLEGVTLEVGRYWEERLSAIQRRYLRAVETLARIRRMGLPAIQVNIGDKQVNVAGSINTTT